MASRVEFAPVPAIIGTRPASTLDGRLDQQMMLVEIHCRRFAGRAYHHDAIGSFRHMKIDQGVKRSRSSPPSSCMGVTIATRLPFIASYA